jgi:uncharacterized protein YbaR (Trm112 family)
MFIELTDHLRCPVDHDESFLVLLPDTIEGRSVRAGQLGCPICGRTFELADGVLDTGDAPSFHPPNSQSALTPEAVTALVGLSGPGGYLVLVGEVGDSWSDLAERNPGVGLVAINPEANVRDEPGITVLRSGRIPLKSRSMRGVVLSPPFADQCHWVSEAARVVLPGLRIVGEGAEPPADIIDLMASAGGVWVGTARRKA